MPLQNLDFQLFDVKEKYQDTVSQTSTYATYTCPAIKGTCITYIHIIILIIIFSHTAHNIKSG